MNIKDVKEWDARLDAWAERRWPGCLARLKTLAIVLTFLAVLLQAVYWTLRAEGVL